MSKSIQPPVELPVGSRLGWELENTFENDQLHSVADSAVLVRSLRQSRERWLLSTFPKFSGKTRHTKVPIPDAPPPPPPHTIQMRGRCNVEIGPHIFSDTIFYEVHYLPTQTPTSSYSTPRPYPTSWQATTPYASSYLQSSSLSASQQASNSIAPLELTTVTPALINQVNSAASSNPILANLLQLAAAGTATKDQLKTLGLLIQSLASRESAALASAAASQQQNNTGPSTSIPQPSVKPFDVVLEFCEMPNERWLFPRGPNVCERVDGTAVDGFYDVDITTCIPFKKADGPTTENAEESTSENAKPPEKTPQVVKLRLKKAPFSIWDTLYRWVGGEQEMCKNREHLKDLKGPDRVYLGYQLFPGSLLSQLRAVSTNIYPMKSIKPAQSSSRSSKKRTTVRKETSKQQINEAASTKQQRRSQPPKRGPTQILCQACGKSDVPLIHGGRERYTLSCAQRLTNG
ncbi:hypothetical protein JOM56_006471 [Amanita muscaria]